MTAPSKVPLMETPAMDAAAFRKQGVLAGLVGAVLLAVWFCYLDTTRGKPLFTPTLLGEAIFRGRVESPDAIRGSITMTLLFTLVHVLVFALIGLGTAQVLINFARFRSRALLMFLTWGALCIAFFGFALTVAIVGPQAIPVRDAFVGNLIAALGMAAYLARSLNRFAPD